MISLQPNGLTRRLNVFNVLLIANAAAIFFAPASPMLLSFHIFQLTMRLERCNALLTARFKFVNVLLVVIAAEIFFAPSAPISLH